MQRLDLFPRIKVSEESCKIFTDFTIHTKAPKTTKKDNLDEDCESKNIAKDNYIVEAVKSSIKKLDRANTNRSDAKSISHHYHRNIICSPLIASTA